MKTMQPIDELRQKISHLEHAFKGEHSTRFLSFGLKAIDKVLKGGLVFGALHTLKGEAALGFTAMLLGRTSDPFIWIRQQGAKSTLYPPGFARFGTEAERLTLLEADKSDQLWCAEEIINSNAIKLLVIEREETLSLAEARRLNLATEKSGALCLLLKRNPKTINAISSTSQTANPVGRTEWEIAPASTIRDTSTPPFQISEQTAWQAKLVRNKNGQTATWGLTWYEQMHHLALVPLICNGPSCPQSALKLAG